MSLSQLAPQLECHLLDTGYCVAWEHHVIQGGRHQRIHCHSLVALLHHPQHGWLLWDTGYSSHMFTATQHLPFSLYRRATPLHFAPELSVAAQLSRWNLSPNDIRRIIISHFHADHISGLRDFPNAELIALESAYADIAPRKGINALRRGFIPALLPTDFPERSTLLAPFAGSSVSTLGPTYDLFNDSSLLLIALPGHARGQIGMLASTTRGRILFAADGCWFSRSIHERRPPSRLTHFFIDDPRAMRSTINHLADFAQEYPDVTIIPSHCPEAFARELGQLP
jgi:glyoxylase-like metal-dependent hydrolase (beta-lactamase superfamily II)